MEVDHRGLGPSLHRAIVSENGRYVASVTPDCCLRLLSLSEDGIVLESGNSPLPKTLHQLIARLSVFRWGPGTDDAAHSTANGDFNTSMPLLLLSDGTRLVLLNPNKLATGSHESDGKTGTSAAYVVADYELGDQYGKLSYATFIFGAEHVLALFEMGAHATIISMTRPHRDDVPNVKFNSDRTLTVSPDGRSLAMLLRNRGQDQITVLGLIEQDVQVQTTFNTQTNDAQGLIWSPDGDPVIAVHDSAAYGPRVLFFSALGHSLKQLEVSALNHASNMAGLGVTNLRWVTAESGTMLAVADGERRVLVRRQINRQMSVQRPALLEHGSVIDGSKFIVWQHTGDPDQAFALQKGAFDATTEQKAGGSISLLEFDVSRNFLATVMADNPKAVWLWQPDHPEPHTVIMFQESVQQLLWHPTRSGILLVIAGQRSPIVYAWYAETKAPLAFRVSLQTSGSTKFQGHWLRRAIHGRHPFMLSTSKSFELGLVAEYEGSVVFKSLLQDTLAFMLADEEGDTTEEISTPSKPGKEGMPKGNLQIMHGHPATRIQPGDAWRW